MTAAQNRVGSGSVVSARRACGDSVASPHHKADAVLERRALPLVLDHTGAQSSALKLPCLWRCVFSRGRSKQLNEHGLKVGAADAAREGELPALTGVSAGDDGAGWDLGAERGKYLVA